MDIKSLFTASRTMRLFMFNSSLFMLIGIWLSGFDNVHWFIYFVPAFFYICGGYRTLLGFGHSKIDIW